jgi:hypothetical protein
MPFDTTEGFQHAGSYYAYLGTSLQEILQTVWREPAALWQFAGEGDRWGAVWSFFWPTAFLFLLAPLLALFMAPHLAFLLASTSDSMGRLQAWYPSILIVLLFWAVAIGVSRLHGRWQQGALILLLALSAAAWIGRSELWPGSRFDPAVYQVSDHDRQVDELLRTIPQEAIVMAQDAIVPHLSHRQDIYMVPWVRHGNEPAYLLFDTAGPTYPLNADAYRTYFYDVLAGADYELLEQADTFYMFRRAEGGDIEPELIVGEEWGGLLRLDGIGVAAAPAGERYEGVEGSLAAGTSLRVELLWETLQEMDENYSVSVRALGKDGRVVGQHDSWPADGHRPTSVLQAGQRFRDVHYLTLGETVEAADLALQIGVYDAESEDGSLLTGEGEAFLIVRPMVGGLARSPTS